MRMYEPLRRPDKNRKSMRTHPQAPFIELDVGYSLPDSLIMPLIRGPRTLTPPASSRRRSSRTRG
jgi:hypothetical protein